MMPTRRVLLAIAVLLILVVGIAVASHTIITNNSETLSNQLPQSSDSNGPNNPTSSALTSPSTTPAPSETPISKSAQPIQVASVSLEAPYNPGEPTVNITLLNIGTKPIVSLQAILSLPVKNYTYVFVNLPANTPLLPNQEVSQTATLIGASVSSDQWYPMSISGKLQDGTVFSYQTSVTIAASTSSSNSTQVLDGLELTMTITKTQYSLGEPVNVTLAITNVSGQTLDFTHSAQDFDFAVYNDTNNLIYQWSSGRVFPQWVMILSLKPNENVTATYVWSQTCNSQSANFQVSPGTYSIVGETGPAYKLQTPPIQITILGSQLLTQEQVRDKIMGYIQSNHPETTQLLNNLSWTGGRTSTAIGAEMYMYCSQGWNFTLSYPVVPNAIYTIRVDYSSPYTGIPYRVIWQGTWQNQSIEETSYMFAQ
jgi:hypothetical protein